MKERIADVPTADGRMEAFITHPEEDGPFPAVLLYMDVWGLREELFDIARRIGTVGYYCIVPDLYYRQGRVRTEFRDADNRMISLHSLDEADRQKVLAPLAKLTDAMVMEDTATILDFLSGGEPVRPGAMGSIGYCLGGRLVLCAAGQFPAHFKASASLHGTELISERESSPHLMVDKFQGELYCGFAEHDPFSPPPLVSQLDALMKPCAVDYRYQVHENAQHGYALPDRDIHDRQAAARDWELIFAMYRRQLSP